MISSSPGPFSPIDDLAERTAIIDESNPYGMDDYPDWECPDEPKRPDSVSVLLSAAVRIVDLQQRAEADGDDGPRAVLDPLGVLSDMRRVIDNANEQLSFRPTDGRPMLLSDVETAPDLPAIPLGIPALEVIVKLAAARLMTLVADTGGGKTRVALSIAVAAARAGHIVGYISTELPLPLVRGILTAAGVEIDTLGRIYAVYGDDPRLIDGLVARIVDEGHGQRTPLIIVDFAQLLREQTARPGDRRDLELERIVRGLCRTLRTLGVAGLLTSQVSRAAIRREIDIHSAADSAAIERLSDYVLTLGEVDGLLRARLAKDRWGAARGTEVYLQADWHGLVFAAASPASPSSNAASGQPALKSKRTDKVRAVRDSVRDAVVTSWQKRKEPVTAAMVAGVLSMSESWARGHLKALEAAGIIRSKGGRYTPIEPGTHL